MPCLPGTESLLTDRPLLPAQKRTGGEAIALLTLNQVRVM